MCFWAPLLSCNSANHSWPPMTLPNTQSLLLHGLVKRTHHQNAKATVEKKGKCNRTHRQAVCGLKLHGSCSLRLLPKSHNHLQDRLGMWLTLLDLSQNMRIIIPKTLEIWICVLHKKPSHSVPRKHSRILVQLPRPHSQDCLSAGTASSLGFVSLLHCQASL